MKALTCRFAVTLVCAAVLVGCSSDESDNDRTVDAREADTTADVTEDAGLDASVPDTSPDTADVDDDGEEAASYTFVNFEYRKVEEGGHSTRTGIEVTLLGSTRITKNGANRRNEDLDDDDAETLRQDYLTEEVYKKMENDTWECGSLEKHDGARYEFEAKLSTQTGSPDPIRVISGCLDPSASHPDTELANRIVGHLQELRDEYFN